MNDSTIEALIVFALLSLGAILGFAVRPHVGDTSNLANICARSKANVELLNLCGETPGCGYTKKEIQETVRSVAACELAKVTP